MHRSFKICNRFPTWSGQWMAPTYRLWHPDCMLQITTTAKGFILSFCRALYRPSVCFGISISVGRVRCTTPNQWGRTAIGQYCEADKLYPHTLVDDAAYPCRPWMLAPFKGHKDGLSREEYHWNFVQNSTRMCVERAFGMFKSR